MSRNCCIPLHNCCRLCFLKKWLSSLFLKNPPSSYCSSFLLLLENVSQIVHGQGCSASKGYSHSCRAEANALRLQRQGYRPNATAPRLLRQCYCANASAPRLPRRGYRAEATAPRLSPIFNDHAISFLEWKISEFLRWNLTWHLCMKIPIAGAAELSREPRIPKAKMHILQGMCTK